MSKYAVGDAAYINLSRYGTINAAAGTVTKVTPSGQVTVKIGEREMRFTSAGREVGGGEWHAARLIDKKEFDGLRAHIAEQKAERAARDAIAAIPSRPTSERKAEILALIEAARVGVEAL